MLPLWTSVRLLRLAFDRERHRALNEALRSRPADRFQTDAYLDCIDGALSSTSTFPFDLRLPRVRLFTGAEADLVEFLRKLLREKIENLLRFWRPRGVFDARIDVLGVLPENHHVDLLRVFDRRRHALVPANRAQTHIQVEELAESDVQRADAAADWRCQRALDADEIPAERIDGFVRQPVAELREALFARKHFHPRDFFRPPYAFSTAASSTRTLARQISGPVPSPSMNGMIGLSGTTSSPPRREMAVPFDGGSSEIGFAISRN